MNVGTSTGLTGPMNVCCISPVTPTRMQQISRKMMTLRCALSTHANPSLIT